MRYRYTKRKAGCVSPHGNEEIKHEHFFIHPAQRIQALRREKGVRSSGGRDQEGHREAEPASWRVPVKGKKVVCLVSGGNIDVTILSRVIKRGLIKSGRTCQLNIALIDKPGQLKGVSQIIADLGGNVISVHHERANEGEDVNGCYLRVELETRNYEHIAQIRKALTDAGYSIE